MIDPLLLLGRRRFQFPNKFLKAVIIVSLYISFSSPSLNFTTSALQEDDDDYFKDYLYAGYNPGVTDPIIDYENDNHDDENENDNVGGDSPIFTKPDFLYSNQSGHRIVEFYAPWCPHCQHFKTHYVTFARTVSKLAQQLNNTHVDFYAISCTAHKYLCHDQNIQGYPVIKILKAGTSTTSFKAKDVETMTTNKLQNATTNQDGTSNETFVNIEQDEEVVHDPSIVAAWDLHPFGALQILGLTVTEEMMNDGIQQVVEKKENQKYVSSNHQHQNKHANNNNRGDETKQQSQQQKSQQAQKSQKDIYNDALKSFDFSLRNSIFLKNGPLDDASNTTFCNWIHLLHRTLPPMWNIHLMIQAILDNLQTVTQDERILLKVIEPYKSLVPPQWSKSCTHGDRGVSGYTCGLWELFHIMTIGVVEWNRFVNDPSYGIITTHTGSAEILRNYIEHFFECLVCKINFINAYDNCAHDRCQRLIDGDTGDGDEEEPESYSTFQDWIELPLWLWETHNAVNVRLMKEHHATSASAAATTTHLDEINVEWPLRVDCPQCWNADDTWNPHVIFKYLRLIYWPDQDDIAIEYRKELDSLLLLQQEQQQPHHHHQKKSNNNVSRGGNLFGFTHAVLLLSFMVVVFWMYLQNVAKVKSGRHKKSDL